MKKINSTSMPVPSKPGPKIISYDDLKMEGGGSKGKSGSLKGEVKSPGK